MEKYRGYVIKAHPSIISYEIAYDGKGSLHNSLLGTFTSRHVAREFIDTYLRGKEEVNGETDASGGSKQIQRRPYHRRRAPNNS